MPGILTPEAEKILVSVEASHAAVFDKPRVMQVVGVARSLAKEVAHSRLLMSGFYQAATGGIDAHFIRSYPGLTDDERTDLAAVADMYRDAAAYRAQQATVVADVINEHADAAS